MNCLLSPYDIEHMLEAATSWRHFSDLDISYNIGELKSLLCDVRRVWEDLVYLGHQPSLHICKAALEGVVREVWGTLKKLETEKKPGSMMEEINAMMDTIRSHRRELGVALEEIAKA